MCVFFSFNFGWYFIHLDCLLRTGGGSRVFGQNPLLQVKRDESYLPTVLKLTVCAKAVTYIQENTLGG